MRSDSQKPTIGVAIITYKAKHHLPHCLPPLLNSPLKPRIVVVNSSSNDGTVEMALEMGVEVLVVPRDRFNHGTTREEARKFLNTDIVVMMTPDAYLLDQNALTSLVEPILTGKASIAYARQVAHDGAGFFESFPREYNYPSQGHVRSITDIPTYGVYTFFCSNACAAYSNAALDLIGGFPHVLLGEDTVATACLLQKGHKIAYAADAIVKHSHRYSLLEEFRRSFDTGLARKGYAHLFETASGDTRRGMDYCNQMTIHLLNNKPLLLPYGFFQTLVKWLGYKMGRWSTSAPRWFKRRLSSQDFYWNS